SSDRTHCPRRPAAPTTPTRSSSTVDCCPAGFDLSRAQQGGRAIVGMEKKLPLPVVHGEGLWARPWRWAKTAFFLVSMLASLLLVCAPPLLIVLLDLLLPPALLSNFLRADAHQHAASAHTLLDQARGFHFRSSLVDLPAVSAARSLLILCKRPALPLRAGSIS
uniref:Uncharacterized protein n=1 Tax=Aegilops tauschii subsp. strangulata TaxID=200361 RepID=A0A453J5S9_AEGTS